MARPTRQPHYGQANVRVTFQQAYANVGTRPGTAYTTHAGTPFTAESGFVRRGLRRGQQVIIFRQGNRERARAYEQCWGHITNANRTYIDAYTVVIL